MKTIIFEVLKNYKEWNQWKIRYCKGKDGKIDVLEYKAIELIQNKTQIKNLK